MFLIYEPKEDSYLLERNLKSYVKHKSVLDMGAGSGIQAETALKNGANNVLAVDINSASIALLKKKGLNVRKSNLFSNIKEKFDVILFNPPYLPQDPREDKESQRITTGGKLGDEIILKFLTQSKKHLNQDGVILLITSSLTPEARINRILKDLKFNKKLVDSEKLFMETIYLWLIKRVQ